MTNIIQFNQARTALKLEKERVRELLKEYIMKDAAINEILHDVAYTMFDIWGKLPLSIVFHYDEYGDMIPSIEWAEAKE